MNVIPPRMLELGVLDLSNNSMQGPISVLWSSQLTYLSVANNKLTGRMPEHICNLTILQVINLSKNSLSGSIPKCLVNLTQLSVLDLRTNNFSGSMPTILGNLSYLENINLNGNKLGGSLPQTLAACKNLEVFDVGNNRIDDVFPSWLSSLPQLKVLILHSNLFHGRIKIESRDSSTSFNKLRILDLSNNYFNGHLPASLFHKFSAMKILQEFEKAGKNYYIQSGNYQYKYSVVLTVKGCKRELEKVSTIFTTIDLSNNNFHGWIPDTVGELKYLIYLNLSYNYFIGPIPSSLGNLTELESLDLSSNRLIGEIPSQLASLTYLEKLNLSQNSLQGSVPRSRQFDTFENTSYVGNDRLCGVPLSKTCEAGDDDHHDEPIAKSKSGTEALFDWAFTGAGYGCGLGIGISAAYIIFTTRKPRWLVEMVERWTWQDEARWWKRPITF